MEQASKECNILLLGSSGAGKTTLINCLAACCLYDKEYTDPRVIAVGQNFLVNGGHIHQPTTISELNYVKPDSASLQAGSSQTESCRVLQFRTVDGTKLRLIDTPGMGDTDRAKDPANIAA